MKPHPPMLLASLLVALCLPSLAQKDGQVANVNGRPITEEAYHKTLMDWYGKEVLEEMILAELLNQQAERLKVTVTDEEVEERLQAERAQQERNHLLLGGPTFEQWLAARGLTLNHFRARLRMNMLLEAVVKGQVTVTEEEASKYYHRNLQDFRRPAMVNISVISVATEAEAKAAREALVKGASWGDVSEQYNTDPFLKKTGGAVGPCPDNGTPIMKAAFALERDGDISAPVQFQGRWYIIKRVDRQSERTTPFEEAKPAIMSALRGEKTQRLMIETRAALIKNAHIQRFIDFPPQPGAGGGTAAARTP